MSDADKVKRGEYLTTVGQWNDCHTPGALYGAPDMTRKLSGSEIGWVGPWGVSYARNLTPAAGTDIAKWTEAELVQTMHTGMRPDSSTLLPPMPWTNNAPITAADVHARRAYRNSSEKDNGTLITSPPANPCDSKNLAPPPGAPAAGAKGGK
jgi:mono/diheme cytochrome c family protein